jgi:two-component system sensor histidine kinase/response regulator
VGEDSGILVVDDERGIREGCRRALVPLGYTVDVADTAAAGLRMLREGSYDLVLLDLMMPGMSGMEALGRFREIDPDIVVIIITGYATVEAAVKTIKQGAYDFISKPFTADDLILVVNQGLEHRRLSLENKRLRGIEEEAEGLAKAKAELEKLDAMKSRFMLTVAHELRAADDEQEMLENAHRRCGELLDMISDLLLLAHMKEKAAGVKKTTVSVARVLEEVTGLLRAEAERKGLTLKTEFSGQPEMLADEEHLRQLWTNLISNSIKYTPRGGRVVASVDQKDGRVVGVVSDTGVGIAADDLPRIFDEFYRTKQAKSIEEHGTGLGLSIVKQIVESYGGTIDVESQLGKGTTVTFTLPRVAEAGEEALEGGRVVGNRNEG